MARLEYNDNETWVAFEDKPDIEIRNRLSSMGFHFSGKRKAWGMKKRLPETELSWLNITQVYVDGEAAEAAQACAEVEQSLQEHETKPPSLAVIDQYDKKWYLHIETGCRKRIKQAVNAEDDPTMLRFMAGRIARRRNVDLAGWGAGLIEKKLAKLEAS